MIFLDTMATGCKIKSILSNDFEIFDSRNNLETIFKLWFEFFSGIFLKDFFMAICSNKFSLLMA